MGVAAGGPQFQGDTAGLVYQPVGQGSVPVVGGPEGPVVGQVAPGLQLAGLGHGGLVLRALQVEGQNRLWP